jgi:hypothetical protein
MIYNQPLTPVQRNYLTRMDEHMAARTDASRRCLESAGALAGWHRPAARGPREAPRPLRVPDAPNFPELLRWFFGSI